MDKKNGLALDGEPWVIQKSNKIIGTYILSLNIIGILRPIFYIDINTQSDRK